MQRLHFPRVAALLAVLACTFTHGAIHKVGQFSLPRYHLGSPPSKSEIYVPTRFAGQTLFRTIDA